jgi:hypothetical protein
MAPESKTNPAALSAMRALGISINPIASIVGALSQFSRTRDRVLGSDVVYEDHRNHSLDVRG